MYGSLLQFLKKSMQSKNKVAILGAGLVGSLLSILLKKRGVQVDVFEKRSDIRKSSREEGRSINMALSDRGIKSLKLAGVYNNVSKSLIPMKGRMMHSPEGSLTSQAYGQSGQFINSISRNELNKHLIDEAEKLGVNFSFNSPVKQVDIATNQLGFTSEKGVFQARFDALIGSDGVNSILRSHLLNESDQNEHRALEHGYKELSIPAINDAFAFDPNHLHIWGRGRFMLIALPNPDKTFTATLFLPYGDKKESFKSLKTKSAVDKFFKKYFKDVFELIPDLNFQFFNNPTSKLGMIKCYPWSKQTSLLIGDSAHAIVPFYGQGMNAGFEDCRIFIETLEEQEFNWSKAMESFQSRRKKDTDAIAYLALSNFIEMRDHVNNAKFLAQKKLEAQLHTNFPSDWQPLYSMVTFSDMPYSEALKLGELQQDLLNKLPNIEDYSQIDQQKLIDDFKSQVLNAQTTSQ